MISKESNFDELVIQINNILTKKDDIENTTSKTIKNILNIRDLFSKNRIVPRNIVEIYDIDPTGLSQKQIDAMFYASDFVRAFEKVKTIMEEQKAKETNIENIQILNTEIKKGQEFFDNMYNQYKNNFYKKN